jgi:hypothetical protein
MVKRKLSERAVLKRQSKHLSNLKGSELRSGKKRYSIYKKGKYVGWVSRKELDPTVRRSRKSLSYKTIPSSKVNIKNKNKGDRFKKVLFDPVVFERKFLVERGKKGKKFPRVLSVKVYTKEQKDFVKENFKKSKFPVQKKGKKDVVDMIFDNFKTVGIIIKRKRGETP